MIRTATRVFPILTVTFFTTLCIFAQLDPTFGTNGKTVRPFPGFESPLKTFLLSDGKVLVLTTNMATNVAAPTYHFVRFNSDGTVDTAYGTNGSVQLPIPFINTQAQSYQITDAVRQADGKIVAVGFDNGNGLVVRLNENGTLDSTFSGDGVHRPNVDQTRQDFIDNVIYQPDGKIVVAGHSQLFSVMSHIFLVRYESNGELDLTFGDQAGFIVHSAETVNLVGLARQSNGNYIALGRGWTENQVNVGRCYRFNSNGSLDNTFTSPEFPQSDATDLLVDSSDRVIVGGNPYMTDSLLRSHSDLKLTRLNSGGGVDSTFGSGGVLQIDIVSGMTDTFGDMIELPDGSIALAATTFISRNRSAVYAWQMSVLKIGTAGTVTGRYLVTDLAGLSSANIVRQPDGKLVITGTWGTVNGLGDVLITRHTGIPLTTSRFRATPFEFTTSVMGISHPAIFRPSSTKWYATPFLTQGIQFGLSTDVPVSGDYLADPASELAVFRPSTATWYIARTYFDSSTNFVTIQWGLPGDLPAQYDYDGDGKYDVAVFRPSDGNWYVRRSSDGSAKIDHWGLSGDKPVIGDYDGDGLGDLAVWRPSSGVWFISRSSDGQAYIVPFGLDGDIPVQEDYDGDLKTDIAVFRPSTGFWYILRTSDGGSTVLPFGISEDIPVPADYDGDRKMDISVYRPSTSRWYRINSSDGTLDNLPWGLPGDIVVEGRY